MAEKYYSRLDGFMMITTNKDTQRSSPLHSSKVQIEVLVSVFLPSSRLFRALCALSGPNVVICLLWHHFVRDRAIFGKNFLSLFVLSILSTFGFVGERYLYTDMWYVQVYNIYIYARKTANKCCLLIFSRSHIKKNDNKSSVLTYYAYCPLPR